MNASNESPDQELFLVIQGLSGQLDSLLGRLRPLSQAPEAGLLLGVDALYRADKDLALLCLRFGVDLASAERSKLIRLACRGGVPVLDPQRLSADDKDLFYERHLRRYAVRIDDKKSPNSAIDALGQLLGLIELRARSESEASAPDDEEPTRVGSGRAHLAPDIVLELPPTRALGSASDIDLEIDLPMDDAYDEGEKTKETLPPPPEPLQLFSMDLGPAGKARLKTPVPPVTTPLPVGPHVVQRAAGKRRSSERLPTIPGRPANAFASPQEAPLRRPRASTAPRHSGRPATIEEGGLQVRFRRGDTWMPARLRNLTLKQVRLAASAAPPLGSALRVFIAFGDLDVSVPGVVVEVINTESSADGSTSFRVDLRDLANHETERLTTMLRKAQAERLQLSRPPARRNRRFAVTWPIAVMSDGQRFGGAALDISEQGLFLATSNLIQANRVVFGIPLDTQEPTIKGRARVAREVTEEMAAERQLSRGYGLQIETLGSDDSERYAKFLVRVRQRSQLHVLVTGRSNKSRELAECFAAAGYAVTQAATIAKLGQPGNLTQGRPDVAVLDETDLSRALRAQFEKQFEAQSVPMLHLSGQAPASARHALDTLMAV